MSSAPLPVFVDDAAPNPDAGFGGLKTFRGLLPLTELDVQARLDGLLARTRVRQTFVNVHAEPLEATYLFPLPDRAAVTGFRLEVAGRVVEGELKEREQARREYAEAMKAGRRASLAEEERPGVFTLKVGNLPPGESARVTLTLVGPVAFADGEASYRFPLVIAPRYTPSVSAPSPLPGIEEVSPPVLLPGLPNPVRLNVTVESHASGLPANDFRCSLPALAEWSDTEPGLRRFRVLPGERLDKDFVLRFRVAADAIVTSLACQPDESGEGGTFALTVVPPASAGAAQKPRDLVFVLDRSGSMGGWKMVAARRALAQIVDTLTPADRCTVLAFDDRIEQPRLGDDGLVPATDHFRFRLTEFLAGIDARGGTELAQPLERALVLLGSGRPGRRRLLVLLTDGQVGNEDQILGRLGTELREQQVGVFTLGIDQAVNEAFLRRLAALGGGSCEVVDSADRLDEVMKTVHRRLGDPVLTKLELAGEGVSIAADSLSPARLPDLYPGAPLVLLGRYKGQPAGRLLVSARDEADEVWTEAVPAAPAFDAALAPCWARAHLRDLEDRLVCGQGLPDELAKRITELSLRYGVLCRFTAFVAVDVKEVVNAGGRVTRVTQPVEFPAGWESEERTEGFPLLHAMLGSVLSSNSAPGGGAGGYPSLLARTRALRCAIIPEECDTEEVVSYLAAPFDATAYRQRAGELLDRLTAGAGNRPRALKALRVQLEALLADLKSVGAPAAELAALEKWLTDAQTMLAPATPADAEIDRLWKEAVEVLEAFRSPVR